MVGARRMPARTAAVAYLHTCAGVFWRAKAVCRRGGRPLVSCRSPSGGAAPRHPRPALCRWTTGPPAPLRSPSANRRTGAKILVKNTRRSQRFFCPHNLQPTRTRADARRRPAPAPHPLATTPRPCDTAGPAAQAQTRHAGARNTRTHNAGLPPATTPNAHARDHAGPPATTPSPARTTPRTSRPTRGLAGPVSKEPAELSVFKKGDLSDFADLRDLGHYQ